MKMMVNRDFVELLQSFDDHDVEFLIAGAHALAVQTTFGGRPVAPSCRAGT